MDFTFLGHSGFWVETPSCYLLFDWWKGTLPVQGEKPLYVFASHSHHDHLNPAIFTLDATLILGHDITPVGQQPTHVMVGNQRLCVDKLVIETRPSTDEGVAFVVTVDGVTLYHAGDLNWWHWDEEPDPWNPQMEQDFKRYMAPLSGRKLDVAMVPLDGRLQYAADWGLCHLLDIATVDVVIPMHQWNDPTPTGTFCTAHPQWAEKLRPMEMAGQQITL